MSSLTATNSFASRLYCPPALIYLLMSLIAIVSMAWQVGAFTIVTKIIFVFIWTWFLNYLCESGYSTVAWFLVFLPFIFILLIMFIIFEIVIYSAANGTPINNVTMAPALEQLNL